jgi:hypothetical protein
MFTNTNASAVRSVATRDVQQAEQFHSGTPGRRLSNPTHRMVRQPFIDPAGTILPVPARVEGSTR